MITEDVGDIENEITKAVNEIGISVVVLTARTSPGRFPGHAEVVVVFGISDRHAEFKCIVINPPVALLQLHLIAVRITKVIHPGPIVETIGIDDEGITIPMPD